MMRYLEDEKKNNKKLFQLSISSLNDETFQIFLNVLIKFIEIGLVINKTIFLLPYYNTRECAAV